MIEQELMRSGKACGGITSRHGLNVLQDSIWLLSAPVTSEINHAMQHFNGIQYQTSDQRKESSQTRLQRDYHDGQNII